MNKKILQWTSAFVVAIGLSILYNNHYQQQVVPPATTIDEIIDNKEEEAVVPVVVTTGEPPVPPTPIEVKPLPSELNLAAPFYSQAPHGDWSFPWQEACEEASLLLAANVYGKHNWTLDEFNTEILNMVEWQEGKFGTYLDTTVAQTAVIANEYLKLETITHENPTYEDVRKILNKGHFILMFFSGKELGNPYFSNGGPVYHVLLVKGYKGTNTVITNDVGTKR
jgi:hypothetical protein